MKINVEYKTYFKFLIRETISLHIYVNAAVVGSIICYFTANYSAVPYIVPIFVQILVRSNVKFRQRHQNALVELPAQTEDPAFIMDIQGNILLSIGNTLRLFEKHAVRNIKEFINEDVFDEIIEIALYHDTARGGHNSVEAFSNRTLKWYEIKAKATGMAYGGSSRKILVWFQEISLRKIYQLRLRDLLRYSDSLMASRDQVLKPGTEYSHLAAFLLKEYEAAFITRADQNRNLEGYVFKNDTRRMIRSGPFTVSRRLPVPAGLMGEENPILSDDADFHVTEEAFIRQIPVDQTVLEAIDVPVRNYIAYNDADMSITAFNFRSGITAYEEQFFEVVVNIYRNMVTLVDMNKKLQERSAG